jgi:uncharacterized membrane protein YfcA
MPDLTVALCCILAVVAFLAGFIDAIAGGGGLLTLPVLLLTGVAPHFTLGTNKAQSIFGSGMALLRFSRTALLDRRRVAQGFLGGMMGAMVGGKLALLIDPAVLQGVVVALLGAVAVSMVVYRPPAVRLLAVTHPWWLSALVALGIGAYDGFFGPGTGTFLIIAYTLIWRDPLDQASANAKVVNFASNLGALLTFALSGKVLWPLALPMIAGQAAGGWLGAHVTVRHGQGLVRVMVVLVSLALIARLAWSMLHH